MLMIYFRLAAARICAICEFCPCTRNAVTNFCVYCSSQAQRPPQVHCGSQHLDSLTLHCNAAHLPLIAAAIGHNFVFFPM